MSEKSDDEHRFAVDIADTVLNKNQRKFSIDKRLSIPIIVAFLVGVVGYAVMFGTVSQSFADLKITSSDHETRIRGLEIDLGNSNREIAIVRGKLDGLDGKLDAILGLIENSNYRPVTRPSGAGQQ